MDYMLDWEKKKQEKTPDNSEKDNQESKDFSPTIAFILIISILLIGLILYKSH